MRMVDALEWDLTGMLDQRRMRRLLNPAPGDQLVSTVQREAIERASTGDGTLQWQPGEKMVGCNRAVAVIPLCRTTFDALFNGRSGYRAQYYLSYKEGVSFNRMLVDALVEAARHIYMSHALPQDWDLIRHSFAGPCSKIWVSNETIAFNEAPEGELLPRRWAKNRPLSIGLRAPLPEATALDLKGTWISDTDRSYQQDPCKRDRDQLLYECGFAV